MEIWADGHRVGSHRLCTHKGQVLTDPEHLKGLWTKTWSASKASPQKILHTSHSDVDLRGVPIPQVQQRPLSVYEGLIDP